MDDILEFIFELIFEGAVEICGNQKISRWIRYPIMTLILLFCIAVILGMFAISWMALKENVLISILIAAISIALTVALILKIRKEYLKRSR